RNQPVNDLMLIEVPPLAADVATELAARLLEGEKLPADPDAANRIADLTGGFPYYIHWVVSRLSTTGRTATRPQLDSTIQWLPPADHDPCDLPHFLKRIQSYYPSTVKIVLALLDHAATSQAPLPQADLINVGKSAGLADDDQVRELLRALAMDHYLSK